MTSIWQTILKQQAQLPQNTSQGSEACFTPLIHLGILKITGVDASDFLQNLFTNDVLALDVNQSQLNGFCNAKGRLLSIFLLIRSNDHYQIILPKAMCSVLQQRLTMYVLRSKVSITDISNDVMCIGLNNSEKPSYFTQIEQSLIQYPNTNHQYLYLANEQDAVELCQTLLKQQWQLTSTHYWEVLDIQAGLPMIFPESKEKFTPQQVNFDLVGGVSFKKGCYPGQEVVARLHYLGKPSRRMFLAHTETTVLPPPGEEITDQNEKVIGHIVRSQLSSDNTLTMLLSLKLSDINQNAFVNGNTLAITDIQSLKSQ